MGDLDGAELLRSQNQSDDDDFFMPIVNQMTLGTTETQTDRETLNEQVVCIETSEGQTGLVMNAQITNPEFNRTMERIDDAIEVSSSDSETEGPEFLFLDAQNADSTYTHEFESTEIPDISMPTDNSNNANKDRRWVFK